MPPAPSSDASAGEDAQRKLNLEIAFLEDIRARLPSHTAVLESLGCLYTQTGRFEDGLRADRAMVAMVPHSPTAWYNLGCSLALTHAPDHAFSALEKAIDLGYDDLDWFEADTDLAPLRQDPRYPRLLARLRTASR